MRIRSTLAATAILGAVALLTAGCLSSGGGGGGNDNTSKTIEVMYAFTTDQETGFKDEVNAVGQAERRHRQVHPDAATSTRSSTPGCRATTRPTWRCSRSRGS